MEALRLRVQDLDFEMKQLTVRDGKGAKDRFTVLAQGVILALREHLANVSLTHQEDLAAGHGAVYLPGALDRSLQLMPSRAKRTSAPGHNDVSTTMIYTHVLRQSGAGMKSLLDCL